MRTIIRTMGAGVLTAFLLAGCGYGFTPVGGIVPEGTRTIAVPVFVNGTYEPLVDVEVTRAVVDEFLTDGRLKVVSPEAADLVLRGTITKFQATPAAYAPGSYYTTVYSVSIGVNVTVEDVKTRKIIWQEKGLGTVFVSSYSVNADSITATKTAKENAIRGASRDVASTLRSRLLEGF